MKKEISNELFDKMYEDVSNGFGRQDLVDSYGEDNVKLYLQSPQYMLKWTFEGHLED